jgi:hypothetical protein
VSFNSYSFEIKDYEKRIKTNSNITNVVDKLSHNTIENNLRDFISSGRPSRFVGSAGHLKTRAYLEEKLKFFNSKGTSFTHQEFTPDIIRAKKNYEEDFKREILNKLPPTDPNFNRWKAFTQSIIKILVSTQGQKGHNFIWEKKGLIKPEEVIVIGANYDTLLNDPKTMMVQATGEMPGADNNGSGVALLLSMIEILDKLDLPKTIRIVFFDFEELGFLGSRAYVEKMNGQKIMGYVNLVMVGHDSKREDKEKKLNNMKLYLRSPSEEGSKQDLLLANLINNNGKRLYNNVDFAPLANSMNASSQVSFWEAGYPAICLSQNWESDLNPRIHTSNDFVETLNMNTYTWVFRYVTGAVLAWNYDIVK